MVLEGKDHKNMKHIVLKMSYILTFILQQALVKDMKESLLNGMDKLLNLGMKVPTIAAWGWFIRILGSHSMKNRNLVNKMLKIPERTFSDHDPQVQIASQVLHTASLFICDSSTFII